MVEYRTSEVYPHRDKKKHIHEYELNGKGSYILEVQTKEGWWCLNATRALGTVGRLLNHSTWPNLKPFHPLLVRGKWRVGLKEQMNPRKSLPGITSAHQRDKNGSIAIPQKVCW